MQLKNISESMEEKLGPGIEANKQPIPPEQILIFCAELEGLENYILETPGIRNKSDIMARLRKWREFKANAARREIAMRDYNK